MMDVFTLNLVTFWGRITLIYKTMICLQRIGWFMVRRGGMGLMELFFFGVVGFLLLCWRRKREDVFVFFFLFFFFFSFFFVQHL